MQYFFQLKSVTSSIENCPKAGFKYLVTVVRFIDMLLIYSVIRQYLVNLGNTLVQLLVFRIFNI